MKTSRTTSSRSASHQGIDVSHEARLLWWQSMVGVQWDLRHTMCHALRVSDTVGAMRNVWETLQRELEEQV